MKKTFINDYSVKSTMYERIGAFVSSLNDEIESAQQDAEKYRLEFEEQNPGADITDYDDYSYERDCYRFAKERIYALNTIIERINKTF